MASTPAVPYSPNHTMPGFTSCSSFSRLTRPRKASGSAGFGDLLPRTTTALSRFDPITAPRPVRPLARLTMFMIAAKRTRFSPAGPICAISTFSSPISFLRRLSTSAVTLPQRCLAGRSSALPSLSQRYTGSLAWPVKTMASAPAARISAGKKPPHWLSPMAPVSGERAHGHDQHVVGAERVGAHGNGLQEEVRGQRAAAGIFPIDVLGQDLRLD